MAGSPPFFSPQLLWYAVLVKLSEQPGPSSSLGGWRCQGNGLISLVKWDRKYDLFSACTHSYPSGRRQRRGIREIGEEAWREEELGDRQDLYLQCRKLILHFIDAFLNQWQIFVVAMASLQQLGSAEPGDLIRFLILCLFPQ
ncbi:hypothetical protein QQF64_010923 [Cirrhinus molitorella]|uniref:Uncharacterized protein n=1 Tax=Cirrhinus molitorella TaxID=172907 RepID=A0ABR3M0V3_9TELE